MGFMVVGNLAAGLRETGAVDGDAVVADVVCVSGGRMGMLEIDSCST
jgi:hypothetical protein